MAINLQGGVQAHGGGWGGQALEKIGLGPNRKQKAAEEAARAATERNRILAQEQFDREQGILKSMNQYGDQYVAGMQGTMDEYKRGMNTMTDEYLGDVRGLRGEVEAAGKDARETYTNQIMPRMKDIMERAGSEASQAMSLTEAGDPNNKIHQAIRSMYGQQAENVGRAGLADAGVLQALGAQGLGQYAGMPLTGAQTQLLGAQALQQGGAAFGRTQQQMERLRQQGIERGFQESGAQYERGERARDRYAGSVGAYEGAYGRGQQMQDAYRQQRYGMSQDIYGTGMGRAGQIRDIDAGMAGLRYQTGMEGDQRSLASMQGLYGAQMGVQNQLAQQYGAQAAGQAQLQAAKLGALGNVAAAGVGGFAGGWGAAAQKASTTTPPGGDGGVTQTAPPPGAGPTAAAPTTAAMNYGPPAGYYNYGTPGQPGYMGYPARPPGRVG